MPWNEKQVNSARARHARRERRDVVGFRVIVLDQQPLGAAHQRAVPRPPVDRGGCRRQYCG
jgi:hypothetical protein